MSTFNPEEFMVEPSESTFQQLRKDDLILLGQHLKLEAWISIWKCEIQTLVMDYLVNTTEIFEQSALVTYNTTSSKDSNSAVEKDKNSIVARENEDREKTRQWQRQDREFRLKEQEIELRKLELQLSQTKSTGDSRPYFDVTKHIRMVPPFQEREVDKYFLHFEKVAHNCHWPKENWTMLLQSILLGKAREIFSQLTVEDSANYDMVKQLILKGHELVPEVYHQKFRTLSKSSDKTFYEFAQEKAQLFNRWCT